MACENKRRHSLIGVLAAPYGIDLPLTSSAKRNLRNSKTIRTIREHGLQGKSFNFKADSYYLDLTGDLRKPIGELRLLPPDEIPIAAGFCFGSGIEKWNELNLANTFGFNWEVNGTSDNVFSPFMHLEMSTSQPINAGAPGQPLPRRRSPDPVVGQDLVQYPGASDQAHAAGKKHATGAQTWRRLMIVGSLEDPHIA